MTISIPQETWMKVESILERSSWIRFSLGFARGRWTATFFHERGKVYGSATRVLPETAVYGAADEAEKNTLHLAERKAQ